MKTKFTYQFQQDAADFRARWQAHRANIRKMTPAQKRAWLIELGTLTPEGEVPVYPMDHVPLGPRN